MYRQERQRYIERDMDRLLFIETERYRKGYSEGLYSLEDIRAKDIVWHGLNIVANSSCKFARMFSLIERREKTNQRKRKKKRKVTAGLFSFLCSKLRKAKCCLKT